MSQIYFIDREVYHDQKPFICTVNFCRSQMAEGFGKAILGDEWNVYSGGLETHGVNPKAVEAMKEVVSTFQIIPLI